ncbi:uncharacterized protein ACA1_239800 [Acanthamoeba castellanii str. Neff]|uniref:ApaG domain-containing protein n=1 Tax=Acanthamoeba castellanii (strain ATCC 30010 / Neff) TaxID=1257118 RepID=L8GKT2_ACACF|nr:uncharacterized protein ACA1_239800 [Acanthamoeba castellanii str. Neff]ELR13343.1 hypothetical protein ACA1_239800 [Acanthamoeba castellanii str. Neff]
MLVFGLPQRVIARLPDSLSLSGRTLTQLIPIVWRNYARAGLEPSASAESGTSDGNADADADTTKPQPLKEEDVMDDILDSIKCMDKRLGTLRQLAYTTRSENVTSGVKIAASTATSLWGEAGLFEYKLTIANVDPHRTFQLISRCLTTVDGTGNKHESAEPGILTKNSAIPKQPHLAPGASLKFSCLAPRVFTDYATLHGSFQLIDVESGEFIDAKLAPLGLHLKKLKSNAKKESITGELRPSATLAMRSKGKKAKTLAHRGPHRLRRDNPGSSSVRRRDK